MIVANVNRRLGNEVSNMRQSDGQTGRDRKHSHNLIHLV